jgi:hypothetical protein
MGCGGSRTKLEGHDMPIDHWMEKIGIEDIDKSFEPVNGHLTVIEDIRSYGVDELEELALATGACAYKEITLEKCYISFFYNAELESPEYYKKIQSIESPPLFSGPELKKNKKAYDHLSIYIKKYDDIKSKGSEIGAKLEDVHTELKGKEADFEKAISEKFKDKPAHA